MRPGRKPCTERDSVSGVALKVHGLFGGRRFTGDLKAAHRAVYWPRPRKGAEVNPFPVNRAACPGAAGGRGGPGRGPPAHRASKSDGAGGYGPGGREVAARPRGMPHRPVGVSQGTAPGTAGGRCGGVGNGHGPETVSSGASVPAPRHRPAGRPAGRSE
jgi:hypothetical protein